MATIARAGTVAVVPTTDPDEELYVRCVDDLAAAVDAALGPWVERSVRRVADAGRPGEGAALADGAAEAGREATRVVGGRVRALLALDVDDQPTGPLAVLRTAVEYPTAVLPRRRRAARRARRVRRRRRSRRPYDLTPGSFRRPRRVGARTWDPLGCGQAPTGSWPGRRGRGPPLTARRLSGPATRRRARRAPRCRRAARRRGGRPATRAPSTPRRLARRAIHARWSTARSSA